MRSHFQFRSHLRASMTWWCRVFLLAFALLGAAAVGAAPAVWQVATGARADTYQAVNLRQFAADVADATHGDLRLQIHTDDSLGKLTEIPRLVETAKLPAGQALITTLQPQIPTAGADTIPFLVTTYEDAHRLWVAQKPVLDRELARIGLVELYSAPWPPQGLFTVKPIASSQDLRGTAMRTYNPPSERIAQLVGARGVNVPRSALAKALAEGTVDALITSGATGVEDQVWTRMKFFYDIRAWFPKDVLMVNKAMFDALPASTREAMLRAGHAAEERGWQASEAAAAASTQALISHGVQVQPPSFALRDELRRFGEHTSLEWLRATGNAANTILIPFFTTPPVASSR